MDGAGPARILQGRVPARRTTPYQRQPKPAALPKVRNVTPHMNWIFLSTENYNTFTTYTTSWFLTPGPKIQCLRLLKQIRIDQGRSLQRHEISTGEVFTFKEYAALVVEAAAAAIQSGVANPILAAQEARLRKSIIRVKALLDNGSSKGEIARLMNGPGERRPIEPLVEKYFQPMTSQALHDFFEKCFGLMFHTVRNELNRGRDITDLRTDSFRMNTVWHEAASRSNIMFVCSHISNALNLPKIFHVTEKFELQEVNNAQVKMQGRLKSKVKHALEMCFRHIDQRIENRQYPDLGFEINWSLIYKEWCVLGGAFRQTEGLIHAEHFVCLRPATETVEEEEE